MKFLFSQIVGGQRMPVIIESPEVKNGEVYATLIGKQSGYAWNGKEEFKACKPTKFIAGGSPWTMVEFTDNFVDED